MDDRECDKCPIEVDRRHYDRQIEELYKKLCDLEDRLDPVIEVWAALSGVVKVLNWIGIFVKWIAIFVGIAAVIKGLGGK